MKPLIPEAQLQNKRQQLPWKKKERDKVLNMFFDGTTPERIAIRLGRNPKAVERLLQEYRYNERNKAMRYEPRRRKSRKGLKMTKNEWMFVKSHDKRKIPREVTSRLLARAPGEILVHELGKHREDKEVIKIEKQLKFNFMKPTAQSLDQLLAHIYLRRFANCKILSDKEYDIAKAEEIEFAGAGEAIEQAEKAETVLAGFPPHIRSLAFYLQYKFYEATGKWRPERLPYESMNHALKKHPEAVEALKKWSKKRR